MAPEGAPWGVAKLDELLARWDAEDSERGYDKGYVEGYDEGYDEGYEEGYDEGYDEGERGAP